MTTKPTYPAPPPTGAVPEEAHHLAAIVDEYRRLLTPRSFEYWLESLGIDEAQRMGAHFDQMVEEEMARTGPFDTKDAFMSSLYAKVDVSFRLGWTLGVAAARGVR